MTIKRVGIIGAGPSGLAAIKACLEEGLEPTAFERENELGGVWVYRDIDKVRYPSGAAVYKCLKTNTSKAFFGFTDFPSPAKWTPFVSHEKCLKYFENYAHHFGLSKYITFNSEVVDVAIVDDDDETTERWRLRYRSSGEERDDIFDAVVVCSGFYDKANLPQYPGLELFEGEVSLGNAYRENKKYADKRVLVVGSGISAGDIATDLSFAAKQTFVSTRRGFKVSAVIDSNGWPIDTYLGRRYMQTVTPKIVQWLWRRESNKRFRVNELGLSDTSQPGRIPTSVIYNDNFVNQVLCGKIIPEVKVERFEKNGAVFSDGTKIETLDAIVFCAGYDSVLPFVKRDIIPESAAERDLYLNVFPVHLKNHTFACVGFFKNFSVGSPVTVIEMQTRWVARIFSGAVVLPSKAAMLEEVQTRRQMEHAQFGKDLFGIHGIKYMDRLATLMGCYPSLFWQFFTDPRLTIHMFFSPVVPASYRLVGPHRWDGAREAILNSWNTTFEGTRIQNERQDSSPLSKMKILVELLSLIALAIFLLLASDL